MLIQVAKVFLLAVAISPLTNLIAQELDTVSDPPVSIIPDAAAGSGEAASMQQPDPDPITPEQEAAIEAFEAARVTWCDTLVEMKSISIRFNNGEDQSPAAKQRYQELRDKARQQMNLVFQKAFDLFRIRKGDFESGSMLATTLEYRHGSSIYENSYEAAQMLLDTELNYPFLYQIAARSALLEGKYDKVLPLYRSFIELNGVEKLKDIDKMVGTLVEFYPAYWEQEQVLREAEAKANDLPRVVFETTRGKVVIELFENEAPNTVANFINLVESGYYDGSDFYQVVDDFLAMGGDPVGDGTSTSGRYIPDEYQHANARKLFRGSLVMAKIPNPRDDGTYVPDTASSQFAIALMPLIRKNETQTVYGRVIEGMEVVCSFRRINPKDKKEKSVQMPPDRIVTARVVRKRDHEYKVNYTK